MPLSSTIPPLDDLAERLVKGERRALARAITLVESTRPDHREQARYLLERLGGTGSVAQEGAQSVARRIGLSGTPGVGKSTFIEALGMYLIGQGQKVAVLAVDPSSARSGGSILGDKTRMEELSRQANAFIRASPSHGALGGVARRTRETIRLVEAAGFDTVLVETVGVGQSETMVSELTDIFLLLLAPAGGDELQGVKRGIMEIADLILVNKADGPLEPVAKATCADYAGALRLMRKRGADPEGYPAARTVSAVTRTGLADAWGAVDVLFDWRHAEGWLDRRRADQAVAAMDRALEAGSLQVLLSRPEVAKRLATAKARVGAGTLDPEAAAEELIAAALGG